tara:strand:+ start:1387 stop:1551 length:165 start_codon:yes stop_codon:yes gene_type:complete
MKAWEFKMEKEGITIETFVYSDTGKDIEERFPGWKVTNIKEVSDPVSIKKVKDK